VVHGAEGGVSEHEELPPDDDCDVGLCIVCGEVWCEDTRCDRCKRNIEEDREQRAA
jgi:hypothetical protein